MPSRLESLQARLAQAKAKATAADPAGDTGAGVSSIHAPLHCALMVFFFALQRGLGCQLVLDVTLTKVCGGWPSIRASSIARKRATSLTGYAPLRCRICESCFVGRYRFNRDCHSRRPPASRWRLHWYEISCTDSTLSFTCDLLCIGRVGECPASVSNNLYVRH